MADTAHGVRELDERSVPPRRAPGVHPAGVRGDGGHSAPHLPDPHQALEAARVAGRRPWREATLSAARRTAAGMPSETTSTSPVTRLGTRSAIAAPPAITMRQGVSRISEASSASSSLNRAGSCSALKPTCSKSRAGTEDAPSVSEAVHRDVLDHGLIEPDIMVGAGIGGVGKNGAAPLGVRIQRRDHSNGVTASVPPDPARHRHGVAVTKRMHDRRHTRQIPSPSRETVIEPVSLGRLRDHHRTLLRVTRPPFDELSQSHDPAATVIACQQRRQISSAQHRARPADRLVPLTDASAAALPRNAKRVRHRASLYRRRSERNPGLLRSGQRRRSCGW